MRIRLGAGLNAWRRSARRLMGRTRDLSLVVPLAFLGVALALVLGWIRQPSAEFALQAQADTLTFETAGIDHSQSILLDRISLAGLETAPADTPGPLTGDPLEFTAPMGGDPITLVNLDTPARWRMTLSGGAGGFRLSGNPSDNAAAAHRPQIHLILPIGTVISPNPNSDESRPPLPLTEPLEIEMALRYVDLDFKPHEADTVFFALLRPSTLQLERAQKASDSNEDMLFGSAQSGSLRINGTEALATLGPLDRIVVADVSDGLLGPLALQGKSLSFSARGRADKLLNRAGARPVDLRPSLLDWLLGNTGLKIAAALLSFFASLELRALLKEKR